MSLKIVAGRSKSGKSTFIYDEIYEKIKENPCENLVLLVPDTMTYKTEYEIIQRIKDDGIMSVEILNFKTFAYKIFEEVGGIKLQEINQYGNIMFLKNIFDNTSDLKVFKKVSKREGFLKSFDSLLKEMKKNLVSVEFLENINKHKLNDDNLMLLKEKINDIIKIYKALNNVKSEKFFDEEDKMNILISFIEKSKYVENSIFWIDGMENLSLQQYKLIENIIKYSKNVTISLNINVRYLKNLKEFSDWEAFKSVYDSYEMFIKNYEGKPEIVDIENHFEKINYHNEKTNDLNRYELYKHKSSKEQLDKHKSCEKELYKSNIIENKLSKYDINDDKLYKHNPNEEMQILEKYMFSTDGFIYDKEVENVHIYSSLNTYTEIEKVAREIVSLIQSGYRWKDICVTAGDLEEYLSNIKKIFVQYNIPYFYDGKRDIMDNPLTKYILSLIDMFVFNFKHDSVFEYLKSGFAELNYEEVSQLENFSLKYGIKGYKWFKPFRMKIGNIDYFNELRKKFVKDIEKSIEEFKDLKSAKDITSFILGFLHRQKVREKIEKQVNVFKIERQYELSSENAQVWNYINEIFEQIILIGENIKIDALEYRRMIEEGFKEIEISIIPPTLDKVTVTKVHKVSSSNCKILFVAGANDGVLGVNNDENNLLQDDELDILFESGAKFLDNSSFREYKEMHSLYKLFSSMSEKLYISYALSTVQGKSLQPSIYVDKVKEMMPKIVEKTDLSNRITLNEISNAEGTLDYLISNIRDYVEGKNTDNIWKSVYLYYKCNDEKIYNFIEKGLNYKNKTEKIVKENLDKIYNYPITMTVSKLENFAQCPFKYFVENILKPEERIVQKVEFYDLGNIYHETIESFTNKISSDSMDIYSLDKETIFEMASESLDQILLEKSFEYNALDANERNKYIKQKIRRLICRSAYTIVLQLKKGKFKPTYTELSIGREEKNSIDPMEIKISEDTSIYLNGRIDRIDILKQDGKSYVNIIDYKSSHKDVSLSDVLSGLSMQLFMYMDAIVKKGDKILENPEIGGVYYFSIDDPMIDGDDLSHDSQDTVEKEIMGKLSLKGFVLEDKNIFESMDNEIFSSKKSDVIPVALNKDGSSSKLSNTLTKQQYKIFLEKTNEVASSIAKEIINGNIDIKPYKKSDDKTPCTYCKYGGVCGIDKSIDSDKYRKIKDKKKNEILGELDIEILSELDNKNMNELDIINSNKTDKKNSSELDNESFNRSNIEEKLKENNNLKDDSSLHKGGLIDEME